MRIGCALRAFTLVTLRTVLPRNNGACTLCNGACTSRVTWILLPVLTMTIVLETLFIAAVFQPSCPSAGCNNFAAHVVTRGREGVSVT